jgi:5-methylcytosine-specific restriction protein A
MALSVIADLPGRVTAAKADWLVASYWIGFTPASDAPASASQCQSTIARQAGNGYVLEYITQIFGKPNPAFESDAAYIAERASHKHVAGRLIASRHYGPYRFANWNHLLKAVVGPKA